MLNLYRTDAKISKALVYSTFVNFLIILVWIVIFKANKAFMPDEITAYLKELPFYKRAEKYIIPGYSIYEYLKTDGFMIKSDYFLNFIAFIPFGILMPFLLKKRKLTYTVITFVGASALFEVFQLMTCIGRFDASDLMTNTLGGFVGILLYKFVFSKTKGNIINIIGTAITVFATPVSIYAIFNTVKHINLYF